jgi:hypothetical protein
MAAPPRWSTWRASISGSEGHGGAYQCPHGCVRPDNSALSAHMYLRPLSPHHIVEWRGWLAREREPFLEMEQLVKNSQQ